MRQKKSWLIVGVTLVVIAVNLVLAPGAWAASTLKLLHLFTGGIDGAQPRLGRLIFDAAGNLLQHDDIWRQFFLQQHGMRQVFELTPNSNGRWAFSLLHAFQSIMQRVKSAARYGGNTQKYR
jgi:hypothetical protein